MAHNLNLANISVELQNEKLIFLRTIANWFVQPGNCCLVDCCSLLVVFVM